MRRVVDVLASALGLLVMAFPLSIILLLVWCQDRHSPFYVADRAGVGGIPFRMMKVRSMVLNADRTGVDSTSASDNRITKLGHFIRRWKVDELSQLWNVLIGDMSLVGPRPNTLGEVKTYSDAERGLLAIRPGITDFSSIVFSDEGEILRESFDPDADYERLIRPWKSELGLIYVNNVSLTLNIKLILLTILAILNKNLALVGVRSILQGLGADQILLDLCRRDKPLGQFVRRENGPPVV